MASVATCPHCGASARFDPNPALLFCCGVCGGPVIPCDAPRAHPDAELAHLVAAQRARAMALGWGAGALVLALSCVFVAAMAWLLVAVQAHASAAILAVVALGAAALGAVAGGRARTQRRRVRESLDLAWQRAAEDVLATRGARGLVQALRPSELAATLRTSEPHAERLLSALSAEGRIRVQVFDDAELAYAAPAGEDEQAPGRAAT
jgi:hypothetical protein